MSEKWWDMSDDELDDLFREASDKAEIPFDSSALNKLRQKIDSKPMPETTPKLKKRWVALVALLTLVGVSLLYTFSGEKRDLKQDSRLEKSTENTSPSLIKNQKPELIIEKIDKNDLTSSINTKKTLLTIEEKNLTESNKLKDVDANTNIIENKIVQNKESNKTLKNFNENGEKGSNFSNKNLLNKTKSSTYSEGNLFKNEHNNISDKKTMDEKILSGNTVLNNNSYLSNKDNINHEVQSVANLAGQKSRKSKVKKSNSTVDEVDNQGIYAETMVSVPNPVIISEEKIIVENKLTRNNFYNVDFQNNKPTKPLETSIKADAPTYLDAPPIVMKQPQFSRFGIRLAVAPDINSLERLSTSTLGSSMGLLLEYRLSKKFILQTGLTFSNKKYIGNFEDYHSWTNNWKSYHPAKPTSVDGGCKIIDVPVNIRFNIYQKPRSTFFISSGISTYFMMNETYTYNYAWAPERTVEWNDKSSFYWSTVNISAGIERKINNHFTFQVEPYLKTPLSNIGRGGVNLYSSGLLFSTKYEF